MCNWLQPRTTDCLEFYLGTSQTVRCQVPTRPYSNADSDSSRLGQGLRFSSGKFLGDAVAASPDHTLRSAALSHKLLPCVDLRI